MDDNLCCEALSPPFPVASPFDRVLSLHWYDGTTSGLAHCGGCSTVFRYDIVDWDSDQERRIFLLSRLDPNEFEHLVSLFSSTETPKWPFWSPKWQFGSNEQREKSKAAVDALLSRADRAEYIIASDRDLSNVFAVKRLSDPARSKLNAPVDGLPMTNDFDYWRHYLRLKG
jgi:hypothetical protein